jgi:DNA polymerase-3 subunit epsilon
VGDWSVLAVVVLAWFAGGGGAAAATRRWVLASAGDACVEQAQVLLSTDVQRTLTCPGRRPVQALAAGTINDLAAQRDQLQARHAAEVAQASRAIEQERNRLAALMSELTQSVVVCNLDGRVLLYNNRARMQFRALSECADAGRRRRAHRPGPQHLHRVRPQAGGARAGKRAAALAARRGHPTAQFVTTTRSGQLLRVQMAPVRGVAERGDRRGAAAQRHRPASC